MGLSRLRAFRSVYGGDIMADWMKITVCLYDNRVFNEVVKGYYSPSTYYTIVRKDGGRVRFNYEWVMWVKEEPIDGEVKEES